MKFFTELITFFVPTLSVESKILVENAIVFALLAVIATGALAFIKKHLGEVEYRTALPIAISVVLVLSLAECQLTAEQSDRLKSARNWTPQVRIEPKIGK